MQLTGDCPVLLLKSHGVFTFAKTVEGVARGDHGGGRNPDHRDREELRSD